MDSFFSEVGIHALDFVQITASYTITMLIFFEVKGKKRFWPNFMLVTFALQCLFIILFHDGLNVKLFAGLMLTSAFTIQAIVTRRRKLEGREHSQAR